MNTVPIKMTKKRKLILDELRSVKSHPTADEVFSMVRKHMPRISLGTVYRNLELLASHGLVLKLESGSGPKRFDGHVGNHYHVRCSICGKVQDLTEADWPELEERARGLTDFQITGHVVEFSGLCPDCSGEGNHGRFET